MCLYLENYQGNLLSKQTNENERCDIRIEEKKIHFSVSFLLFQMFDYRCQ